MIKNLEELKKEAENTLKEWQINELWLIEKRIKRAIIDKQYEIQLESMSFYHSKNIVINELLNQGYSAEFIPHPEYSKDLDRQLLKISWS